MSMARRVSRRRHHTAAYKRIPVTQMSEMLPVGDESIASLKLYGKDNVRSTKHCEEEPQPILEIKRR